MIAGAAYISKSGLYADPREDWLAQHREQVIDPARPIVDPHHHLWDCDGQRYLIEEMSVDIGTGHNIVATIYVDSRSMYRAVGPESLRPIGEVEFANGVAAMSASGGYGKAQICAGIVSHVNLLLGEAAKPVLEAEIAAGGSRFRGIRHSSAWDSDAGIAGIYTTRPRGLLLDATFRKGFACLAPLDLSFDAWLFHPQIGELVDLARAFPDTKIVLDHCGGPLGLGRFAGRREETFSVWKASITDIAKCPNVVVKLGGLAMRLLSYDFHERPQPPSSEELAAAWRPYIETCIEAFGAGRAMFESNFPPDKGQCSYQVIFNAFKRITESCSEDEKSALFAKTAVDFYRLDLAPS
ncbi:amidohydrolase [Bradyrhizobium sp. 4]|uniref:amidohydrolase family protein n=1 Tax=unclassified Bradyrhizobium TaxID=2631580 RepID=UPI001FF82F04|nr:MULTISPECIES: amidohydrolase family protein [unclassified Bradyrhizobium]MCK1396978.1 amidohydrolase [Bradyrhizobium sp. 39]MCK1634660.1 amidohydrolase [Bradyrhizobium sp. 162]MCK1752254.1 amidohydrolase [Bradyrhizobium sp. 135]UPJ36355.1 amidohydrolase [Bradyrhizobium sp. 4]